MDNPQAAARMRPERRRHAAFAVPRSPRPSPRSSATGSASSGPPSGRGCGARQPRRLVARRPACARLSGRGRRPSAALGRRPSAHGLQSRSGGDRARRSIRQPPRPSGRVCGPDSAASWCAASIPTAGARVRRGEPALPHGRRPVARHLPLSRRLRAGRVRIGPARSRRGASRKASSSPMRAASISSWHTPPAASASGRPAPIRMAAMTHGDARIIEATARIGRSRSPSSSRAAPRPRRTSSWCASRDGHTHRPRRGRALLPLRRDAWTARCRLCAPSKAPSTGSACRSDLLPAGAARNALDCALWDLEAKQGRQRAWKLAGLPELEPVLTAYTLSLDAPPRWPRRPRPCRISSF